MSFFRSMPGLPASCRHFFAWMCVALALIGVHAIAVLIEGAVLHHEVDALGNPISSKLYFYGITQLLLGVLAMRFTVSALRRENEVQILCALTLTLLLTVAQPDPTPHEVEVIWARTLTQALPLTVTRLRSSGPSSSSASRPSLTSPSSSAPTLTRA